MSSGRSVSWAGERERSGSYRQIVMSSAWIGASSVLSLVISLVRTKIIALLIGPAGVGLLGVYSSIIDLTKNIAGLGINPSGVRQLAAAAGRGDRHLVSRTALTLRIMAVLLGLAGAALLAGTAFPVSWWTFGSTAHVAAVAALAFAVFFQLLAEGHGALLQGLRRIDYMARNTVFAAATGTVFSIMLIGTLREQGVVPALVAMAAASAASAWWFSARLRIARVPASAALLVEEAVPLLKLGIAFMGSGILMLGATYAVRIMVLRGIGVEAAGSYQAAWALGGLYIGMILQAMGADFYPRLVASLHDRAELNRLVNEQAQVGLLLAGPGVLATISLAPIVVSLFYSLRFLDAVDVLRWFCLGMTLRVVTWPLSFVIVAQGRRRLFLLTELLWAATNVGLAWICIRWLGLSGAGVAFLAAYAVYGPVLYLVVRRATGFRWSGANTRAQLIFLLAIIAVLSGLGAVPGTPGMVLGAMVTLASGIYALGILSRLVDRQVMPARLQQLLARLQRAPEGR